MGVFVQEMIDDVRRDSGLKSNQLYTDPMIAGVLSDGKAKLRDIFIDSKAHWFRKSYRFSLSNGNDGNTLDLSNIPDLQMDQYLNRSPDSNIPEPITRLESIAERARFSGIIPGLWNGGRRYDTDGQSLTLYPAAIAGGDYELFYTPMEATIAIPTTPQARTVVLTAGDVVASIGRWTFPTAGTFTTSDAGATFTVTGASGSGNNGAKVILHVASDTVVYTSTDGLANETFGMAVSSSLQPTNRGSRTVEAETTDTYNPNEQSWAISDAAFTQSDVGAIITANLSGANRIYNLEYQIVAVLSPTFVVTNGTTVEGFTNPTSGTFEIDRRQLGTVFELPQVLAPWKKFLTLFASISIRNERNQELGTLYNDMYGELGEHTRATRMAKTRTEGVRQAPMTHSRSRRRGYSYDVP